MSTVTDTLRRDLTRLSANAVTRIVAGTNVTVDATNPLAPVVSATGGGGSSAWGDITGTLSAQTDLQTALDAKANSATTLSGYGITDGVGTARTLSTTAPLTGGGNLSANRTLAMPAATASADGYATATQITKLNGIATGATANDTDANLKNRANHTGTQLASTISDFASATAAIAVGTGPSKGTLVDVVNTASKTAAATIVLPANVLTGTKSVQIKIGGDYLNNSGATKTILLEAKLGATVMWACTSGALTAGAGRHAFSATLNLCALNSSSAQFMHGTVSLSSPLAATTGNGDISAAVTAGVGFNTSVSGPSPTGAAEDGTTSLTFTLSVQHSAAASTVSFQVVHSSVEYLN